jgi:nicotinamidase/pyrazinamidase
MKNPGPGDALLVVDVQNDFLPEGALGVRRGDEVIPPINRVIDRWQAAGLPIFFSRDWHTPNHCSFKEQGGPWPVHCVAGTRGAECAAARHRPEAATLVSKATQADRDAYSAFQGTGLTDALRRHHVSRLFVGGLATDYCVLESTRDARRQGLAVTVLTDAVRAVEVNPGDGERALEAMVEAGAMLATTNEVLDRMGARE